MKKKLYLVIVDSLYFPPQVGFVRSETEPWGIEALKALDFSYYPTEGDSLWIREEKEPVEI